MIDIERKYVQKRKNQVPKAFRLVCILLIVLVMGGCKEKAEDVNLAPGKQQNLNGTDSKIIASKGKEEALNTEEDIEKENIEGNIPSTVKHAKAKNTNDLTGTYVDEEQELQIVIIEEEGKVTYNFCGLDDSEPFIETDCRIEADYIAGQYYYITKNLDGSLAISSGAGGSWGKFVKVDEEAIIDMQYLQEQEEDWDEEIQPDEEDIPLTYDLDTDIINGSIYANNKGQVVDASGKVIQE